MNMRLRLMAFCAGAAMYHPLAVAVVADPTLVTLRDLHVDVENKGEFTRGETVADRMGSNERNLLHGEHYEIEGYDALPLNARVCVASDSERFVGMFISRIKGKVKRPGEYHAWAQCTASRAPQSASRA